MPEKMNSRPASDKHTPDLDRAIALLESGHTCAIVRGELELTCDLNGIRPLIGFIDSKVNLSSASAADKIVGRAAALLFVLLGVTEVWGDVMSEGGANVLSSHGISYDCRRLVPKIINRAGTGRCPMEEAVDDIDSPADALVAIKAKLKI